MERYIQQYNSGIDGVYILPSALATCLRNYMRREILSLRIAALAVEKSARLPPRSGAFGVPRPSPPLRA